MKDPNDKQTLDFANLVTEFEQEHGLKRPVGRPPKGDRAMTNAEKQKAYRDRQRAARDAERARLEAIGRGEPVTSALIDLTTDFRTLYQQQNQGKDGA